MGLGQSLLLGRVRVVYVRRNNENLERGITVGCTDFDRHTKLVGQIMHATRHLKWRYSAGEPAVTAHRAAAPTLVLQFNKLQPSHVA